LLAFEGYDEPIFLNILLSSIISYSLLISSKTWLKAGLGYSYRHSWLIVVRSLALCKVLMSDSSPLFCASS